MVGFEELENEPKENMEEEETPTSEDDSNSLDPLDDSESLDDSEDVIPRRRGRRKREPSFAAEQMFLEDEEEDDEFRDPDEDVEFDRETLRQLYDSSMKDLREGNVVSGHIIEVDDTTVLVDIGYKSEGVLQRQELEHALFPVRAEVGQEVEVVLEAIENQDGRVLLSKRKADRLKFWEELRSKFQNSDPIDGTIISRKRGGYTVDIQGIKAFLPGSQLDLHPVRDMDEFVGRTYPMKILSLQVEGTHRNIVLSRRAVLEEDLKDRIEATLGRLQEGRIVKGIVKNITDWGVFVDLGGIDGLLHRTDISWGRTEHPSQYFEVGDEVSVMVLRFDRDRNQVSLGYKQKTPDPWLHVEEKYYEGAKVNGHVVSLKQYGAFVELEESVQGLLHVSEMSWTRRIEHPSQMLAEGQELEVVVLRVDATERKISLGLKQLTDDPWVRVADKYPVGSRVDGIVREISNIGCKVEVDEDIVGFLHRSNITWSRHMRHPADILELGDTLELVVLEADPENHKLSLGLKQIKADPWDGIEQEIRPDMIISGKVINILDFGAFVEVRPGVEGLVHISEIANKRINHPGQVLKQDQEVNVKVLSVNEQDHRLSLSIRECLGDEEEGEEQPFEEGPPADVQDVTSGQQEAENFAGFAGDASEEEPEQPEVELGEEAGPEHSYPEAAPEGASEDKSDTPVAQHPEEAYPEAADEAAQSQPAEDSPEWFETAPEEEEGEPLDETPAVGTAEGLDEETPRDTEKPDEDEEEADRED